VCDELPRDVASLFTLLRFHLIVGTEPRYFTAKTAKIACLRLSAPVCVQRTGRCNAQAGKGSPAFIGSEELPDRNLPTASPSFPGSAL
jgi:hypothetical protein